MGSSSRFAEVTKLSHGVLETCTYLSLKMKLFLRLPACEEARGKAQDADALRVSQEAWRPGSELRVQTEVQKDPLVSSLRPHSLSFLFSFPASPVVSLEI